MSMLIYFVTDVHGSEVCFRKFLNSYPVYRPDVMIVGGDITGKTLVPLVRQANGTVIAPSWRGDVTLETSGEVAAFKREVADTGAYTYRLDEAEYARIGHDKVEVDRLFKDVVLRRLEDWATLAEERLKHADTRIFVSGGNDDLWEVDTVLREASRIECPDRAVVDLGSEYEMLSCGLANKTPWNCPRDVTEEELNSELEGLVARRRGGVLIANLHAPPYGTPIDSGPLLDENQRPKLGVGGLERQPIGSRSVRAFIERHQPLLSLHGHVHESRGVARLGATMAVNPGSEYSEGVLRGALVTIKNHKVKSYQFTAG